MVHLKNNQIHGVNVKLSEVRCVEFEICDIIVNFTVHMVQKFSIKDKVICFCIHNTNTNCGKAQNQSNNNVLTKLGNYEAELYLELIVSMHNSQLCAQTSCSSTNQKSCTCWDLLMFLYVHRVTEPQNSNAEFRKIFQPGEMCIVFSFPSLVGI